MPSAPCLALLSFRQADQTNQQSKAADPCGRKDGLQEKDPQDGSSSVGSGPSPEGNNSSEIEEEGSDNNAGPNSDGGSDHKYSPAGALLASAPLSASELSALSAQGSHILLCTGNYKDLDLKKRVKGVINR